jgi:hypothetical protein
MVVSSSKVKIYLAGEPIQSILLNNSNGIQIPLGSNLVIGGDHVVNGQNISRIITQFNVWDREVSEKEVYSMSAFCHAQIGAMIVAWPELCLRVNGSYPTTILKCLAAGK